MITDDVSTDLEDWFMESQPQTVLAIDPGTDSSGWVILREGQVIRCGSMANAELLEQLRGEFPRLADLLAIEMFESFGMPVGREVFETCVWIGRFVQAWREPEAVRLVPRKRVKLHLCQSARAKDPNVRQALIDRLGKPGTKKEPGPTYGVSGHAWSALAVAVTAIDEAAA